MTWQHPEAFYLLWLIPAWIGLALFARARTRRAALRFVEATMAPRILPAESSARFWMRTSIWAAALVFGVMALARPRWGEYFMQVRQRGSDVYVLLDVSKSMLAQDVPPSRLQRAKGDIKVLLERLHGERVGLIAFAGKPSLACPLTSDHGFFRLALDEVGVHSAPRGGTAIGDAIRKALEVLPKEAQRDQAILLITDGEDHESYPLEAAEAAAERKVAIFSVGLGDREEGARIPARSEGTFVTYSGQHVHSKMDAELLQKLAMRTGGAFVAAGTRTYDLGQIYEDHLSRLRGEEGEIQRRKRLKEQFQIPLALAVACFLAHLLLRRHPARETRASAASKRAAALRASAGGTVLTLVGLLAAWPLHAGEAEPAPKEEAKPAESLGAEPDADQDAVGLVREGVALYEGQAFESARQKFAAAQPKALDHEAATVAFNLAAAMHRKGDLEGAAEKYTEAGMARDKVIAAAARFNLGNLRAEEAKGLAGGKPEDAGPEQRTAILEKLERAAQHYRECLELERNHPNARRNLELVREWIKHYSEVWRKKDRDKRREETDLLAFLQFLIDTEKGLQAGSEALAAQDDAFYDEFAELKRAQEELAEDVPYLERKIADAATSPPQPGAQGPAPALSAEQQKVVEQLTDWAKESGVSMDKAVEKLGLRQAKGAAGDQEAAVEKLERIWEVVVPFRELLKHNLDVQTRIAGALDPKNEPPVQPPLATSRPASELRKENEALAKLQDTNARRTGLMVHKAKQELERLEQTPAPAPADEEAPPAPQGQGPDPQKVKEGLEKAVELGPKALMHEEVALQKLEAHERVAAFPEAEEARRILEEIMKAQPQDPQQNQDQQDQDQQNQDQQDKQDQQDQKEQEQQKQEEKKDQPDKEKDKVQPSQQPQPQEMTKEQAEAILRRVQEREQERRKKLKEIQGLLLEREEVDKDW